MHALNTSTYRPATVDAKTTSSPSRTNGQTFSEEQAKADVVFSYYNGLLGNAFMCQHRIDLAQLNLPQLNLQDLMVPFTADEVARIARESPSDRAPGTDGFTRAFYKAA